MNADCPFGMETGHYLSHPTVELSLKGEAQQFGQKHLVSLVDTKNFLSCFDRQLSPILSLTDKTTTFPLITFLSIQLYLWLLYGC